jgi:GNAT superfamily N-acetyltransferase
MYIREFEPTPADYKAVVDITNTVWPKRELEIDDLRRADAQHQPPYVRRRFLAEHAGEIVGHGLLEHRENMYHPQRFWLHIDVLPEHGRQGIGTALYDHMLTILKSDYDANELHARTTDNRAFSIQFLEKHGFQEVHRNTETRLQTADFDWARFSGFDDRMGTLGIEIRVLRDLMTADEDALYKVYELHQTLNQDSPSAAQRTRVNFESWRKGYSSAYRHFVPEANFVALHGADYVGLSGLWGDPASDKIYTGMTGVLRAYRRQGIATALKLKGIAFAREHDIPLLITHNKSHNPMLQLNLKLGFVIHGAEIMFMQKL